MVVDANHRWAGQSLELEVKVMSIRGPEIASGADKSGGVTSSTGIAFRERSPGSMMPDGSRGGEKSCP